jgi:DNA mismatch repair protein MutH
MILTPEQLNEFNKREGFTTEDIINDSNIEELKIWINNSTGKSKGFVGEIYEFLITKRKGDNKAKPDFNGIEIKTITWCEEKKVVTEKMSLTSVSYSTIENETFETSHVFDKSKIFCIKLTKHKNPLKRKFMGFGIIDLLEKDTYKQVKNNYNYIRDLVCNGKAHLFTSRAKVLGENQILHVRTAGTRKYNEYTTKSGIKYLAKPYNFTLDYKVLTKLLKPILI